MTYLKTKVVGVQATLASPKAGELPVGVSSVHPGQSAQWALDIFGTPKKVCRGEEIKGEMWDYAPFPLSIEVQDGRVFSIKIFAPEADVFGPSPSKKAKTG